MQVETGAEEARRAIPNGARRDRLAPAPIGGFFTLARIASRAEIPARRISLFRPNPRVIRYRSSVRDLACGLPDRGPYGGVPE
jgi:hypothetical protein